MKHHLYRHVFAVSMLAMALAVVSASAESLSTWVASVDEVNPAVQAAKSRWDAARAMVGQADTWPDPEIGADVIRIGTQFSEYDMIEYMVEQKMPWFGKRGADIRTASLEAEAVGFEYLEVRRKIQGKVISAAWEVWKAGKEVEVTQDTLQLARETEAIALARQEAGQGMQADLLRTEIEQATLSNEIATLRYEREVALAHLNELLNAPLNTPREPGDPPPIPSLDIPLDELQAMARQYCCMLMATLRRQESREAAVEAARLEYRPMVGLRVAARQFEETGDFEEYDTGVFVNIPWLWRGKYRSAIAEAEADHAMAEADLQMEINATLANIQELYTEAEARQRTMRLYENTVIPKARALVDSSLRAYQSGTISALELLDAQKMFQEALMTMYREKAGFGIAYAELNAIAAPWNEDEMATGLPPHE